MDLTFFFMFYFLEAGFGLWIFWRFVQAFANIVRSLRSIASTFRETAAKSTPVSAVCPSQFPITA
jgi:hypothetical protein